MRKFKALRNIFTVIALILSHTMCAVVAFEYCNNLWSIEYKGFSAPADVAFINVIPYGVGIIICVVLALVFNSKARKRS